MNDVQNQALHKIGSREQHIIRDIESDPTQAPIVAEHRIKTPSRPKMKSRDEMERFGRDSTD